VSDNSSDETVKKVKNIKSKKVELISNNKRMGKSYSQSIIMLNANSDYLLILDADVSLNRDNFISLMINKFAEKENIGLVCAKVLSYNSTSFIGSVLAFSQEMKESLYLKIRKDNPVYLCNGRAMVYSKALYKKIHFPVNIIADDAFAALFCLTNNIGIEYQEKAVVNYKIPNNLKDHLKQSTRFLFGKKQLAKYYDESILRSQYLISKKIFLVHLLKWSIVSPIKMMGYCLITVYANLISFTSKTSSRSHLWAISESSK
jgi:GT2 family glycosyltransferase